LAFENSICSDYVTEKFFNAMNSSVVPIVLGGANYSAIAPIKSNINAYVDFKNPEDLARFLQDLMDDPQAYAEYFWWKQFYKVVETDSASIARYQCDVCTKLHEDSLSSAREYYSNYSDLTEWWEHKSRCRKMRIRKQQ
jgi:alpha-1,3-fucosyltransferase